MAIDTATKRRAALGRSTFILPIPAGAIGEDQRSILLHLYLLYDVIATTTPLARIYAIAQEIRTWAIGN